MRSVSNPETFSSLEGLLVRLDAGLAGSTYRVAVGFAAIPALERLGVSCSGWWLAPGLAGILVRLRVLPAAIRCVVPFSDGVKRLWALLHHDWVYRWKEIFHRAGIAPTRGMIARESRLKELSALAMSAA